MGILSRFGVFDTDDIDIHTTIAPAGLLKMMRAVNALREHILDTTPFGGSVRTFKGHDHADSGPPLTRSCVYCEDNGNLPLWTAIPTAAGQLVRIDHDAGSGSTVYQRTDTPAARYYVSPLLPPTARLQGRLFYLSSGGNFKIRFHEVISNSYTEVDLPEATGTQQAFMEFELGQKPGVWNKLFVYAIPEDYQADNEPELNIHALALWETIPITLPRDLYEEPI